MPIPELSTTVEPPAAVAAEVLVIGVRPAGDGVEPALPAGVSAADLGLDGLDLGALGVGGAAGDLTRVPAPGTAAGVVALIGLGGGRDAAALRGAAATAVRRLAGRRRVAIALPLDGDADLAAVLEGAALGAYAYTASRGRTLAAQRAPVAEVVVVGAAAAADGIERARVLAEAVGLVKDLVNTPAGDLWPEALAARAVDEAGGAGMDVKVWDLEALQEGGFGGIVGVGAGSVRPPRLVRVGWSPEGATASIALVGKGITFDSGGLSLKPAASMVGMKSDMTGAAVVLAVAVAAARLRLPVAVTAWLCIAENMPSGSAIRPGDVLRIRGGRTVEVLNTDAEGRLVLADGLTAAAEEAPDAMIDVATLTGAVITALGTRYVGAMGDGGMVARAQRAAVRAGELVWHLPLPDELRTILNSDVADIANTKIGNTAGGALVAGQFLREFVGDRADGTPIPWLHLDIAGAALNAGAPWGTTGSGATGVMVATLLALLEDLPGDPVPGPAAADASRASQGAAE